MENEIYNSVKNTEREGPSPVILQDTNAQRADDIILEMENESAVSLEN